MPPQQGQGAHEALPPPGTTVSVHLPTTTGVVCSRVEDVDDGIAISAPIEQPSARSLQLGDVLWVSWTTDDGLYQVQTRLRGREAGPPPSWRLEPLRPAERHQRRASYRVPVMGSVRVLVDGTSWRGRLIDLSDSGARCLLPAQLHVTPGQGCVVALDAVRHGLQLDASVVRIHGSVDADVDVAMAFEPMPIPVGDELRRFLLGVQIQQRQP